MTISGAVSSNVQSVQTASVSAEVAEDLLPDEMVLKIFNYFGRESFKDAQLVSKQWRRVAEDDTLWRIPANVTVIDSKVWGIYADLAAFGLDLSDAPALSKKTISLASEKFLSSVKIEKDAGITILTMPKGLTLNKLARLARLSKAGNKAGLWDVYAPILREFGDNPIAKTNVVAISNSVLEKSRDLSFDAQKALLEANKCEVPGLLEMVALNFMTYMSSASQPPIRLFNDHPYTYSRCQEVIEVCRVVVGGFTPIGLSVNRRNYDFVSIGVAAVRKL